MIIDTTVLSIELDPEGIPDQQFDVLVDKIVDVTDDLQIATMIQEHIIQQVPEVLGKVKVSLND